MNKSHITDEQVDRAVHTYLENTYKPYIVSIRLALEAAFPEPSIQELLFYEERSARHDDPHQPAAFGPLVVTEYDAEEINYAKDIREALQSFVNRHAIKPIAFADQDPPNGSSYWGFETHAEVTAYYLYHEYDCKSAKAATHWLPASTLPIPEAIDAKESAWREYCSDWSSVGVKASRLDFLAGYDAAQQAGGAK